MEILVLFVGFYQEKQSQTNPTLFSPQIYLGVEKTNPILKWINRHKLLYERILW